MSETARLLPLLRELGDLKRIRSAARDGSIATRLFRSAWAGLIDGRAPADVALAATASALAATRLGDLDCRALRLLGLTDEDAREVQRAGVAEVSGPVDPGLAARLAAVFATEELASLSGRDGAPGPPFVTRLEEQPRAGVTCPGRPRIVLQPPENHAEHCLIVAVYGVLLAPGYGADATRVFLAGLSHHFHNVEMPDAGFAGETLLGGHLGPMMSAATGRVLSSLPEGLRPQVEAARAALPDAETPEGRAFHAADVLDRVLEIEQHLRAARLGMDDVLGEMGLVHDGPVKPFHDRVLAESGLC